MSDILEPIDGHILPAETHVRSVIDFATGAWDRRKADVVSIATPASAARRQRR